MTDEANVYVKRIKNGEQVIDVWADVLESGLYEQAPGFLKTENGYCCLGVLCDLHEKATGLGSWDGSFYTTSDEENCKVLIESVAKWASLDGKTGVLAETKNINGRNFNWLTEMNDAGISFKEIASYIRDGSLTMLDTER